MEEQLNITEDEVLAAWRQALSIEEVVDNDDARTINELCEAHGIGYRAMHSRLRAALAAGTMEKVKVHRINVRGQRIVTDAYILRA